MRQGRDQTVTPLVTTALPGLNKKPERRAQALAMQALAEAQYEPTYGSVTLQ